MGLMESLKSYWNSVPASKVYPQIKDHVSNVYTTLAPSTKPEDRKQAAGKWAESVIDGIAGMGPSDIGVGGLMGYTRNGIPHNDPAVVNAYIENIISRVKAQGNGTDARLDKLTTGLDGNTRAKIIFSRDGADTGFTNRRFMPEGVETSLIENYSPKIPGTNRNEVKMKVIPAVYPAEAQFMRMYGGDIGGSFVNENTSKWFQEANPNSTVVPMESNGKWVQDRIDKSYGGLMDFPVKK